MKDVLGWTQTGSPNEAFQSRRLVGRLGSDVAPRGTSAGAATPPIMADWPEPVKKVDQLPQRPAVNSLSGLPVSVATSQPPSGARTTITP